MGMARAPSSYEMRLASWVRDFTSSFLKTFPKWYCTVRALMNKRLEGYIDVFHVSFAVGIGKNSKTRYALIGNSVSRAHYMKAPFWVGMANPNARSYATVHIHWRESSDKRTCCTTVGCNYADTGQGESDSLEPARRSLMKSAPSSADVLSRCPSRDIGAGRMRVQVPSSYPPSV